MTSYLLLFGFGIITAGAGLDLLLGVTKTLVRQLPFVFGALGSAAVVIVGIIAVHGRVDSVPLGQSLGVGQSYLRIDRLAGLFLILVGGLGVLVSFIIASWVKPARRLSSRGHGAGYMLLLGSTYAIICAGDAYSFLFAWELLTVSFYVLTSVEAKDATKARSSWITLVVGKVGGVSLLLGFLLAAAKSGSFNIAQWHDIPLGTTHDIIFALVIVGFAAKVGVIPFHVWIPVGYPQATGPIRAAMAGVAANVGFYGLWRFLEILGHPPIWLAASVLVVGGTTALLGIVFAAVQSQLSRVVAYSSIENAGIILVGYGVALAGIATGNKVLAALGILAASLQILAHATAKSLLFTSSAFFETSDGGNLDSMSGVYRTHRASGSTFAIGAFTLAGLPPAIGFVSEWMILESLMQEFRLHILALRLAMAFAGALVALTTGIASLAFIRLIGLVVLRRPPQGSITSKPLEDKGWFGTAALILLALACLLSAAFAPLVIRYMSGGLSSVANTNIISHALKSPWVLQPVYSNFSILSPSWLFVVIPTAALIVFLAAHALSRGEMLKIRRVAPWHCGADFDGNATDYSAFGYSNILRHVLRNILGTSTSVSADDECEDSPGIQVHSIVSDPFEFYVYRPIRAAYLSVVSVAKRLQSGRLDAYVAYMLVALIVMLTVVAITG